MAYGFIQGATAPPYVTITFDGQQGTSKQTSSLSSPLIGAKASYAGEYGIVAGGYNQDGRKNTVNAFNTNGFARIIPTQLTTARENHASAHVGNYALFAGGFDVNANRTATVEVYDASLTHLSATNLNYGVEDLAGTNVGNYALFAGGYDGNTRYNDVNVYSSNLNKSTAVDLTYYPSSLSASRNPRYAIFAGGWTSGANDQVNTVNAYNESLDQSTPLPTDLLSVPRERMATATAGNYALFVAGMGSNGVVSDAVDAYDLNLVRTTLSGYGEPTNLVGGATLGTYALFAGGIRDNSRWRYVRIYRSDLTATWGQELSTDKCNMASTNIGNGFALFAGGNVNDISSGNSDVDIYSLPNQVQVYPGTKYKLGSMANEVTADSMQTITVDPPIKGYIKIKKSNLP